MSDQHAVSIPILEAPPGELTPRPCQPEVHRPGWTERRSHALRARACALVSRAPAGVPIAGGLGIAVFLASSVGVSLGLGLPHWSYLTLVGLSLTSLGGGLLLGHLGDPHALRLRIERARGSHPSRRASRPLVHEDSGVRPRPRRARLRG